MTTQDKVGLMFLIALMVVLALTLIWSFRTLGPPEAAKDSYFVRQRLINLQKSD